MSEFVVVLDAGTGAGRCIVYDREGRAVASAYREWQNITPDPHDPERREFSPEEWWTTLASLVRSAVPDPRDVSCITCTSQREGVLFLDGSGRVLYAGPNIDFRALGQGERLARAHGREIYDITGHWPHGIFAAARILWFKENAPEVVSSLRHLLLINDWITYRLSGQMLHEPSNACETLLYDIHGNKWSEYLFDLVDIPRTVVSDIVWPGTVVGRLTREAARETGLLEGTLVCAGGGDTQCAVLGTGGCDPFYTVAVCGSSTPVQTVLGEPLLDPGARMWTCSHAVKDRWVLDSSCRPTGVVYRWLRDTLFPGDPEGYEKMNDEAAACPPGSNGALSFMGPSVSNTINQVFYPGTWAGITPGFEPHLANRGIFPRSVLENIAFAIRGNCEQIHEVSPSDDAAVHVTGGMVRGRVFQEILSGVLGREVYVHEAECTGRGAAILAAVGTGLYSSLSDAVRAMVEKPHVVTPDPEVSRVYERVYRRWVMLDRRLREMYSSLR
ncbi:MAG: FGGY-family carbohydrate kinase [Bacillota bacterium]